MSENLTSRPLVGLVPDIEGRYHPCSDLACVHDGCYAMRYHLARERAAGHTYRGPGYCQTCGVREDLHTLTQPVREDGR